MSTMRRMRRRSLALGLNTAAVVAVCLCFASCGGSSQDGKDKASVNLVAGSVGACLRSSGATVARSSQDISFLSKAETADQVSKPGFAYDRTAKIAISVWTSEISDGNVPRWTMWIGQPFGETRTPNEIVNEMSSHSYVLFVELPSKQMQSDISKCINFSVPQGQGQVYEHRIMPGT